MSIADKILLVSQLFDKPSADRLMGEDCANAIHPPRGDSNQLLVSAGLDNVPDLSEFYRACDGIDFGDIWVGYYLNSMGVLLQVDLQHGPLKVVLDEHGFDVRPFGSTSGGDLLVVDIATGRILFLPPDRLEEGYCY